MITVSDITVHVIRKDIKNLHLTVHPPDGRVRVSAPKHLTDDNVRLAIVDKLGWIKKQQIKFKNQPRQSKREMVTGESHYFLGKRYLLEVNENNGRHEVSIKNNIKLILNVNPGTSLSNRQKVLDDWYRSELKKIIPDYISKYEMLMDVKVSKFGVKRMKTRWGTCNTKAKRIWLNLELAKKSSECLEYIVVHEMAHLLESRHNDRFVSLMDKYMPKWKYYKDELNKTPTSHFDWKY